jgi:hypothetical protein
MAASYEWPPTGGTTGTVTSVGLTAPSSILSVSGSPVIGAGVLSLSLVVQNANTVFAGPTTGAEAAPTFRSLVTADLPFSIGNLTDAGTDGITIRNGTGCVIGAGTTISQQVASASFNGYLASTDWNTFNSKQSALSFGNLTDTGTDGITIGNGTGSVIGSGTTISQHVATGSFNGYLASTDWTTFNAKQSALTFGNLTDTGTDGITVGNGAGSVIGSGTTISQQVADTSHNGYLASTDWNTFNAKQSSGNYLTALTGDGTASGPGSSALTLSTVNTNVGSFTYASLTVNAKGLVTAASNGTAPLTSISVATANGFSGSSSGGTTPALTLTTSVTGILQGNGTAISAATTTGSGSVVLATSPTLVTPSLGTPTALVGTHITGTAASLTAGLATAPASGTAHGVVTLSSGGSFQSVAPGTSGNVLTSNGTDWISSPSTGGASISKNILINSAFDLWQRGTSTTIANTATSYQPDRWYGKNSLGTNGVLTLSQTTGVTNGSKFGASLQITTAPTAAQTNGCELYQTLENNDSYQLYNQTASFSILVKSLHNVTQVGVQFYYATSETKVTTAIGSEVLTTVNSSTFTACTISGQALGTGQTVSGVIGVRVRITAVSTGNVYDISNGFICEQGILNLGSSALTFQRIGNSFQEEFAICQRYCQMFNNVQNANPKFATGGMTSTTNARMDYYFPVIMRATPSMSASGGTSAYQVISGGTLFNISGNAFNATTSAYGYTLDTTLTGGGSVAGFGCYIQGVSGQAPVIIADADI